MAMSPNTVPVFNFNIENYEFNDESNAAFAVVSIVLFTCISVFVCTCVFALVRAYQRGRRI